MSEGLVLLIYRAVIGREDDSFHSVSVPGALSFGIGLVRSDWSKISDSIPKPTLSLKSPLVRGALFK